ncbi:MAG: hypothetical protein R2699_03480 [Acidimicrobiales bacterium]
MCRQRRHQVLRQPDRLIVDGDHRVARLQHSVGSRASTTSKMTAPVPVAATS